LTFDHHVDYAVNQQNQQDYLMPFIEIFDFNATPKQRATATRTLTDSLCEAYGIPPSIVSAYFFDVGTNSYGHEGKFGENASNERIFIKIHAFCRKFEHRAKAAELMTKAAIQAYDVPPKHVVIYFLDRDPSQVSHGGVLESSKPANPG
jgi:phenylpyruvate tautomerase PptA (4-oxalocrotonate tautomerase family)